MAVQYFVCKPNDMCSHTVPNLNINLINQKPLNSDLLNKIFSCNKSDCEMLTNNNSHNNNEEIISYKYIESNDLVFICRYQNLKNKLFFYP